MDQSENDDKIDIIDDLEKADRLNEHEEGTPFWYVNKDSFPMTSKTWERMWAYVEKVHPDGPRAVSAIRSNQALPKVIKCDIYHNTYDLIILNIDTSNQMQSVATLVDVAIDCVK